MRQLVGAAAELGADSVLTVCYTKPSNDVLHRLDHLAQIAADVGVRLALEFAPGLAIHPIGTARAIVDQLDSERVRMAIDTWHFFRGGSTWAELETVPLTDIGLVQFDDAPPMISEDIMSETLDRRTWPGAGMFDLTRFATTLTGRGWSGIVSVEVLSDATRGLDADTFSQQAYATAAPYWPS
jgi:sugar phosphate isomerase/epimerase